MPSNPIHHITVQNGATDVITYVLVTDSTNHNPQTGLTITDFDLYYIEERVAISAKADVVALAAVTTAHTDNRGIEIGMGWYRIDWPDACFDGGKGKRVKLIVDPGAGSDDSFIEVDLSPPVNTVGMNITDGAVISNTAGHGLTVSTSNATSSGISTTGNTTGAGLYAAGGATGPGIYGLGGASGGYGLAVAGQNNYSGLVATGNGTQSGIEAQGGATGHGMFIRGGATSGHGIYAQGHTSGTAGSGLYLIGRGDYAGLYAAGGATGHGIHGLGGTNGTGLVATGQGTGNGFTVNAGATGKGIDIDAAAGDGIEITSAGAGNRDVDAVLPIRRAPGF